jgi:uncharacterized protein YecE (DUF72 family)
VSPRLAAIAAALPRHVHLGTSSWSFPGWSGIVWAAGDREPSQTRLAREGLGVYARHPLLRAVGVDRTFYAPVPAETFAAWADDVPADFRFLVKGPRSVLEPRSFDGAVNPGFLDADRLAGELLEPAVRGLGERLGVLVLQFPPIAFRRPDGPDRLLERLAAFLGDVRARTDAAIAVEIRNRVLVEDGRLATYRDALDAADMSHGYTVHPSMPGLARQVRDLPPRGRGPIAVRWMLRAGETYQSARDRYRPFDRVVDPDPEARDAIADLAASAHARARGAIVIANNKAEGSAPLTLARLAAAMVDGAPTPPRGETGGGEGGNEETE